MIDRVCPYLLLPSMYLLDEKLAEHERWTIYTSSSAVVIRLQLMDLCRKSRIGRIDSYFQKLQPLWLLLSVDEQQERTSEVLLVISQEVMSCMKFSDVWMYRCLAAVV